MKVLSLEEIEEWADAVETSGGALEVNGREATRFLYIAREYHRLREVLKLLGNHHKDCQCFCMDHRGIAREALKESGEE